MKNEIKEILDVKMELYKLKQFAFKNSNDMAYIESLSKTIEEYITNLQEENTKLKSELECCENGVYFSSENDRLQKENDRLNNIINKAIEYIEKDYTYTQEERELLDILKGE